MIYSKFETYDLAAKGGPQFLKFLLDQRCQIPAKQIFGVFLSILLHHMSSKQRTALMKTHILKVTKLFGTTIYSTMNVIRDDNNLSPDAVLANLLMVLQTTLASYHSIWKKEINFKNIKIHHLIDSIFMQNTTNDLKNGLLIANYMLSFADIQYLQLQEDRTWDKHLQSTPWKSAVSATATPDREPNQMFHCLWMFQLWSRQSSQWLLVQAKWKMDPG